MIHKTCTIDGKCIAYYIDEKNPRPWVVEVGKGRGSYKPRYRFGGPAQAVEYFNGINIGNGYKKRLRCETAGDKPITVARS